MDHLAPKCLLALLVVGTLIGMTEVDAQPKKVNSAPKRILMDDFSFVVPLFNDDDNLVCSATIIRHGMLLTAKHCFYENDDPDDFYFVYSTDAMIDDDDLRIPITAIRYDGPGDEVNDIAVLYYQKKYTEGRVKLQDISVNVDTLAKEGDSLLLVSYPITKSRKVMRIASINCIRQRKIGTNPPLAKSPGYDGTLLDTNCLAFWGSSGGPIFQTQYENGQMKINSLEGVVTHSFDLKKDGSVDRDKMKKDSFGKYLTLNYSPFKQSNLIKRIFEH
ncbi:hypothetical protein BTA51_16065 [Hahella sp. CCB-MM4]|uniref:S1 family peptidase n=1 Tax=Hahella sp. (strain CCB-MM4) TaxID=1926491 RepID=UPI000B9ADB5A|nr:serine protease [Hahella sp. CCB-MM4]OZG72256.1 hypothetical protein BTA51_16065 [Hahella sp. CCB-MM4]